MEFLDELKRLDRIDILLSDIRYWLVNDLDDSPFDKSDRYESLIPTIQHYVERLYERCEQDVQEYRDLLQEAKVRSDKLSGEKEQQELFR